MGRGAVLTPPARTEPEPPPATQAELLDRVKCACPLRRVAGDDHDGFWSLDRGAFACVRCDLYLGAETYERLERALAEYAYLLAEVAEPIRERRRARAMSVLARRVLRDYCAEDGERGARVAAALYLDAPNGWQP